MTAHDPEPINRREFESEYAAIDAERDATAVRSQACPGCGHPILRHGYEQHWPEGTCSTCRREMSPFSSGNPRPVEDVCKLTSTEAQALLDGAK